MEFKGTKSPWYLQVSGEDIEVVAGNLRVASLNDTNDLFFNGDLIAAAPELLSELIRLRNIVASYKQDSGDNLDITDAVIAKALGKQ